MLFCVTQFAILTFNVTSNNQGSKCSTIAAANVSYKQSWLTKHICCIMRLLRFSLHSESLYAYMRYETANINLSNSPVRSIKES